LDLDDWQESEEGEWAANDWILSYTGQTDRPGELTSNESVERIGFVVDVRLKDSASGAVIEAGPDISVDLRADPFVSLLEPEGRWNRVEAWSEDGLPVIEVNGTRVTLEERAEKSQPQDEKAHITLRPLGDVEFCNLYVRSLAPSIRAD
jgi:hypothetical protein